MHYTRDTLPSFNNAYTDEELAYTPWYYSVELEPGRYTDGQGFWNVGLTRTLLARADVRGRSCIDIGTMEALIPTVLCRAGAGPIVAYDRAAAMTRRIELVKRTYGVHFELLNGFPLSSLRARLGPKAPFDIVVNSGVLYHLFSPLAGLAATRGILRNGGLMVIETAAVVSNDPVMYWNEGNRYTGDIYFLPSLRCLDYLIRFLRMRIIDAIHIPTHKVDGHQCCRIAATCIAEDRPVGDAGDTLLQGTIHTESDMSEHIDWMAVRSQEAPVPYRRPDAILGNPGVTARASRAAAKTVNLALRSLTGSRIRPIVRTLLRTAAVNTTIGEATAASLSAAQRIDDHLSTCAPLDNWKHPGFDSIDLFKVATQARPHIVDQEMVRLSLATLGP